MESLRDQKIKVFEAGVRAAKPTETEYITYLKRDEWSELDVIRMFHQTDTVELVALMRASINADKEIYSRQDRDSRSFIVDGLAYFFDPFTIIHWAIVIKELTLPIELVEWHGQQLKLNQEAAPQLEPKQTNQPGTDTPAQSEEGIAGGLEAETLEDAGADNPALEPREGGYLERDKFAIDLVKERDELLTMRQGEIKAELQKASDLFNDGRFTDWWRTQKIFPKGKGGRTKGSRNRNKNG